MAEVIEAELKPLPSTYNSSRGLFEVLVGDDTALPLVKASSAGNVADLQTMLAQSPWSEIVLQSPHRIASEIGPRRNESELRSVLAKPMPNLERLILKAAENGQFAAVLMLLDFASQNSIDFSSVVGHSTIKRTIMNGHAAVLSALAAADSTVATFDLGHATQPLELAIKHCDPGMVKVLLQLGATRKMTRRTVGSYRSSWLSRAARDATITEMLLQHGETIAKSGALHIAAAMGALDSMRLLVDHGADVDERLPESGLPLAKRSLLASWTPMHFAASTGQEDALKMLKEAGAQADVKDRNGTTPLQLLTERR